MQLPEATPEHRKAMDQLKHSLEVMEASGLGSDALRIVLEDVYPEICNEMAYQPTTRSWHRKTDPYYYRGSQGAARLAEASIVRPPEKS